MDNDVAPAEAQARRLEQVYEHLLAELDQPEVRQRLRNAPGETGWSVMQILGHMAEMIPYWLNHCRTLITAAGADRPPQFGRSLDAPERLEGVERGQKAGLDELLHLLKQEIAIAAATIRSLSPAERGRKGRHIRRGEMTVADILESFIVAHAEEHLAQVRQTLEHD